MTTQSSLLLRSALVSPAFRRVSGFRKPLPGVFARNVSQSDRSTISRPQPVECVGMSPRLIAAARVLRATLSRSAARGTVQHSETNGTTIFAAFFFATVQHLPRVDIWINLPWSPSEEGLPCPVVLAASPHSVSEFFELVSQFRNRCVVCLGPLVPSGVWGQGGCVSCFQLACQCVPNCSAYFQAQFVQAHLSSPLFVFGVRHSSTHYNAQTSEMSRAFFAHFVILCKMLKMPVFLMEGFFRTSSAARSRRHPSATKKPRGSPKGFCLRWFPALPQYRVHSSR
jgi:hypothetical protein